MSPRRVWIVGAGKRVKETAVPAFLAAREHFEIAGVLGRNARNETLGGATFAVRELAKLDASAFSENDLAYVAVGKQAVPEVLGRLARLGPERFDLLVDTPVLLLKHFRHAELFGRFRNVWVAEDCFYLPWLDVVREELASGELGPLVEARFLHAAYAYHGFATLKALFGVERIRSARRKRIADGFRRTATIDSQRRGVIVEPRDYAKGWIELHCAKGAIGERGHVPPGGRELAPVLDGRDCVGFRVGERDVRLAPREVELARGPEPGAGVTARQEALKRVGFLRLVEAIAAGRGGYLLETGLDDMLVDYALEKSGRWHANALTSIDSKLARTFYSTLSRVVGR
ncbi:MAG: hypothetical protein L6Q99_19505 [Planctomycetes bacterium]|nr:hypothetical protein [Planctomycetota bacterium]